MTGRTFAFTNSINCNLNCKSNFVVYLISCVKCGRQYVGQTRQALHKRLNSHRASIVNFKLSTYLCQHFNNNGHSFEDVSIQIVDWVDTSSMTHEEAVSELNFKEDFYMKVLNTFYPMGLNDRIQGGGCISMNSQQDCLFFSSPIPRRKRGHGIRRYKRNRNNNSGNDLKNEDAKEMFSRLSVLFEESKFADFYRTLRSVKSDILKILYRSLLDVNSDFACVFTSFFFWHFGKKDASSPTAERATLVVKLNSRKVDSLNIPSIVSSKEIVRLVPDTLASRMPFRIYYKLRPPIALQFCNYSKFLKELTLDGIKSICESKCACSEDNYKNFIYEHYGHVFTGNLDLVQNEDLRKVMQFGAKFRLDKKVSWDFVQESLEEDFAINMRKLVRKYKVTLDTLRPWYDAIMDKIKVRIRRCKNNKYMTKNGTTLKSFSVLNTAAAGLHSKFIVSTVDKASNNFSFVCKKFYVLVLLEELGFNQDLRPIGNVTYSPEKFEKEDIVIKHSQDLSNRFHIDVTQNNKILPKLFWIPKLHKDPFKFRFIAGARNCTTKQLSVIVNLGLKVIKDNFRTYCDAIRKNSGYNYFWSISSTLEFIHNINKVTVHSLQVFDFSTLYTNIDQSKVLEHLFAIFKLIFNNGRRRYMCVRFDTAFFASKAYSSHTCFDLELFSEAVSFIINEVYVSFGGLVFKQIKGIPMGGNCSPLLADLFLCHCEFMYMTNLVKNKKFGLARLLSNTTRYIDDLCIVNYKHFNSLIKDIYPEDLIAERSGSNDKSVDYLDVKIDISKVLRTSVFHKVDNFNFPVILLTFPESLIPEHMGYHVYAGQVLRYLRICSHVKDFIDKTKRTRDLMINRGYNSDHLKFQTEKIVSKYSDLLLKFNLFSARQISILLGG